MNIMVVRPDRQAGYLSRGKCLEGGSQSQAMRAIIAIRIHVGLVVKILPSYLTFRRFYQHIARLSMNAIYRQ